MVLNSLNEKQTLNKYAKLVVCVVPSVAVSSRVNLIKYVADAVVELPIKSDVELGNEILRSRKPESYVCSDAVGFLTWKFTPVIV